MDIKSFFISIFGQDLIKENHDLQYKNIELEKSERKLQAEVEQAIAGKVNAETTLQEFKDKISKPTKLDEYCCNKFKKIPMIAYKQKREIRGKYYSIALNELITPNAYEVIKFKKGIVTNSNLLQNATNIGNAIAKYLTWEDDKNLDTSGDYYLYPQETLARQKGDCEDHASVAASMNEEIGMAYGSEKDIGWHCFNVFVYQGNLFVLDTVGNSAVVSLLDRTNYKIYYIITANNAYQVDGTEKFGIIAGWD